MSESDAKQSGGADAQGSRGTNAATSVANSSNPSAGGSGLVGAPVATRPSPFAGGGAGGSNAGNTASSAGGFQPPARVRSTPADPNAGENEKPANFFPSKSSGGNPALQSPAPLTKQNSGNSAAAASGGQLSPSAFKPTSAFSASPSSNVPTPAGGAGGSASTTNPAKGGNNPLASPPTPQQQQQPSARPLGAPLAAQQAAASGSPFNRGQPPTARGGLDRSSSNEQLSNLANRPPTANGATNPNNTAPAPQQQQQPQRGPLQQNPMTRTQLNPGTASPTANPAVAAAAAAAAANAATSANSSAQRGSPFLATMSPALGGLGGTPSTTAPPPGVMPPPMNLGAGLMGGVGVPPTLLPQTGNQIHQGQLIDPLGRVIPTPSQFQALMGQMGPLPLQQLMMNPQLLAAFQQQSQLAGQQQLFNQQQQQQRMMAAGANMNRAAGLQQPMLNFAGLSPQQLQQAIQQQQIQNMLQQQATQNRQNPLAAANLNNLANNPLAAAAAAAAAAQANRGAPAGFPNGGAMFPQGATFPGFNPSLAALTPQQQQQVATFQAQQAAQAAQRAGVGAPGMPGQAAAFNLPGAINAAAAAAAAAAANKQFPPTPFQPNVANANANALAGNGLSAGPGAVPAGASSVPATAGGAPPAVSPPVEVKRKPLAIFDPSTNKEIDFTTLEKPGAAKKSVTQPLSSTSSTPAASPALNAAVAAPGGPGGPSVRPEPLDLTGTDVAGSSEKRPLDIVSPTTYERDQKEKLAAGPSASASPAPSNSTPGSATPSLTPSTSNNAISSLSQSTTATSTTSAPSSTSPPTATNAASSTATTSTTASTLSSPQPYAPLQKRPLMSLSPQPGAGSGLPPSSSSDSLRELRNSANASPTVRGPSPALPPSSTPTHEDGDGESGASNSARKRGPILPLSGGVSAEKTPYRVPGKSVRALAGDRPLKDSPEAVTTNTSSNAATAPTNANVAPAAESSAASAAPASAHSRRGSTEGARVINGRTTYDRDFLLSFSHITDKPYNFPAILQPEIEVRAGQSSLGRGATSPGPGGKSSSASGGKDDKWSRGHNAPLQPSSGQDVRRVSGMAPQGGRNAFAQAQQSAVRADQRNRENRGSTGMPRDGRQGSGDQRAGNRQGAGRDQRGDNRRGGQSGQQNYLEGPVAPLAKSATRWLPGSGIQSDMDRIRKKVQGLLNKLALDKFDTLTHQLIDLIIEHKDEGVQLLVEVVKVIFDKALSEQFFSSMYADLCVEVSKAVALIPEFEPEAAAAVAAKDKETPAAVSEEERLKRIGKKSTFRALLLNHAQLAFENGLAVLNTDDLNAEEKEEALAAQKRRFLGNIKFVGELFKKGMLIEKIMHSCIAHLIGNMSNPSEEDLEAVCNLLLTVGKNLDHPKAVAHMDSYFSRFKAFSQNKNLSSRVRFMCLDLIDLRNNKWESRRKPAEVKSLDAVRKEAAQEAASKQAANARGPPFGTRTPLGGPLSLRPSTLLGKTGSQDVRGGLKSKDRYSSMKVPTTPTAASTPSTPAAPGSGASTPVVTITASMLAAKTAFPSPLATGASSTSAQYPHATGTSAAFVSKKSPSPAPTTAAPVDPEAAPSLIRSIIDEFLIASGSANAVSEARQKVEELGSPSLYHIVVSESTIKGLNDNKHRVRIAELCADLFQSQLLEVAHFEEGITEALSTIDADFISDDMPKAPEFLGSMFGIWVERRCVDINILQSAAQHLIECGKAIEIWCHSAKVVYDRFKEDAVTTRSVLESGGLDLLSLMGQESASENLKERAFVFKSKPFLLQLYPTYSFDAELRDSIEAVVANDTSIDRFVGVLTAHASFFIESNFARSIVDAILAVCSQRSNDTQLMTKLFTALHQTVSTSAAFNSQASEMGILQTIISHVLLSLSPSGLLQRCFNLAIASGLVSSKDALRDVVAEGRELGIATPNDINDAVQ